jgi:hypothetical protein
MAFKLSHLSDLSQNSFLKAISKITVVLISLNLLWRIVRYALAFPLWGDEASLVENIVLRDFFGLFAPLDYVTVAPLGLMWTVFPVISVFGPSEWALRLVPFIAGVLSMFLFWRLASKVLERTAAFVSIAIFAAAYYPLRHGVEIKPYATDLLVALVLACLAWEVSQRPQSARWWAGLIAASVLGVWFSFPSIFVAGGVALFLAYHFFRSPSAGFFGFLTAYGVLLLVSFAAMVVFFAGPHSEVNAALAKIEPWINAFPPTHEPARLPMWLLRTHTGNMLAYPVGGKNGGSTLTLLLVVIGSVSMWRHRKDLLILLLGPLPLVLIAAALHRYPYGDSARVSIFMAPAFCLLAGLGLASALKAVLPDRWVPAGVLAAGLVMVIIAVGGIVRDIGKPYKTFSDQENRRVIRWLRDQTSPNDQWVVFSGQKNLPHAPEISVWGGSALRFRFYLRNLAPVPIQWAPVPAEVQAAKNGRTWFVVYKDNRWDFPEPLFAPYLAALTQRLGQPRLHAFRLGRREAINVYEFSPSG